MILVSYMCNGYTATTTSRKLEIKLLKLKLALRQYHQNDYIIQYWLILFNFDFIDLIYNEE